MTQSKRRKQHSKKERFYQDTDSVAATPINRQEKSDTQVLKDNQNIVYISDSGEWII